MLCRVAEYAGYIPSEDASGQNTYVGATAGEKSGPFQFAEKSLDESSKTDATLPRVRLRKQAGLSNCLRWF